MLEWTVSSCFMILAVLVLRGLAGRRISARGRYSLWGLVLLRLLVPVQLFASPVLGLTVRAETPFRDAPVMTAQSVTEDGQDNRSWEYAVPRHEEGAAPETAAPEMATADKRPVRLASIGKGIWLAGSAVLAAVLSVSNIRFSRKLRRFRRPLEQPGCPLAVYIVDNLPSPCLYGLFHPAIYMREDTAEHAAARRHVLVHEETHYRHLDSIWNLLRCAALVIHWWNPLVWLAAVLSRRDGEMACDEGALARLGNGERISYGETLLSFMLSSSRSNDPFMSAMTMTGGKNALQARMRGIAHIQKTQPIIMASVIVVSILTLFMTFTRKVEASADTAGTLPPLLRQITGDSFIELSGLEPAIKDGVALALREADGYREPSDADLAAIQEAWGAWHVLTGSLRLEDGETAGLWMAALETEESGSQVLIALAEESSALDWADWYRQGVPMTVGEGNALWQTVTAAARRFRELEKEQPSQPDIQAVLLSIQETDIQEEASETLAAWLREAAWNRVSRLYDYDTYHREDTVDWGKGWRDIALTDGSILHLVAGNSVYIVCEMGDRAPAAFFQSEKLHAWVMETADTPTLNNLLSSIQAEDFTEITPSKTVTAESLADALRYVAQQELAQNVQGFSEDEQQLSYISARYVRRGDYGEQEICLEAGNIKNLVRIHCEGQTTGIVTSINPDVGGTYLHDTPYALTGYLEDEALYRLVLAAAGNGAT